MDPITYYVLPILALVVKRAKRMRVPENPGTAAKTTQMAGIVVSANRRIRKFQLTQPTRNRR